MKTTSPSIDYVKEVLYKKSKDLCPVCCATIKSGADSIRISKNIISDEGICFDLFFFAHSKCFTPMSLSEKDLLVEAVFSNHDQIFNKIFNGKTRNHQGLNKKRPDAPESFPKDSKKDNL